MSPSDVYRHLDKSHQAEDVWSKFGVTVFVLELKECDVITGNAALYGRMNDNLSNSWGYL